MIKCKIIAEISDDNDIWSESFITYLERCSIEDAISYLEFILNRFNSHLRPHETVRKLVNVISVDIVK